MQIAGPLWIWFGWSSSTRLARQGLRVKQMRRRWLVERTKYNLVMYLLLCIMSWYIPPPNIFLNDWEHWNPNLHTWICVRLISGITSLIWENIDWSESVYCLLQPNIIKAPILKHRLSLCTTQHSHNQCPLSSPTNIPCLYWYSSHFNYPCSTPSFSFVPSHLFLLLSQEITKLWMVAPC